MFIEVIAAALLIGLISGGKFSNLGRLSFRYVYAIFGAYLLQVGIDFLSPRYGFWGYPYLHILSYLILFFALVGNRKFPGMYLILAGTLLNFVVIAINGGLMPVRADIIPPEAAAMLATGHGGGHGLLTGATRWGFLADVFFISLLNQKQLISIGDMVIDIGVLVLIILGMRNSRKV